MAGYVPVVHAQECRRRRRLRVPWSMAFIIGWRADQALAAARKVLVAVDLAFVADDRAPAGHRMRCEYVAGRSVQERRDDKEEKRMN